MSCCPPAPQITAGEGAESTHRVQDTAILPGETVECYMKRAGNPSGLKDDLTEPALNKIATNTITANASAQVNVTFALTAGSTRTPTSWTVEPLPAWLTLSGATLTGTAPEEERGKPIKLTVTASDADGAIDSRGYAFSAVVGTASNSIQLVMPLVGKGVIVRSPFGPRLHPIRKVMAPHNGIDLVLEGRKIGDIVSAADGVVTFAGFRGAAGNFVQIEHKNAAGQRLCITKYMHLESFCVAVGQKVAAGQKIGVEGSTGASTGPHLHFEVQVVTDGKAAYVDPVPLIRGSVEVASTQNPDGSLPPDGPTTTSTANGIITKEDAAARTDCPSFGPSYPQDPSNTNDPVPSNPPSGDPFEAAWFFTMKHEVGPHWMTEPQFSPGDSELDAGLKETTLQRRKTGYVNTPKFPGGETKFGIAQGPNPNINVSSIDYAASKQTGFNNYWKKGPHTVAPSKKKAAVMLFDMYYLHGPGNARSIMRSAGFETLSSLASSPTSDEDACKALNQSQLAFMQEITRKNSNFERYIKGWTKRANELYQYALSLPNT